MIKFPSTAHVGRTMPKEAFYKQLKLSPELRDKFVSDVRRITVEYSLTSASINVDPCEEVSEILVLGIQLKKQEFDCRIVESIARQNPHKLLFLLAYEDSVQAALYHGKLYTTAWQPADGAALNLTGRTLQEIWQGLIEQVALTDEPPAAAGLNVEERLKRQEQIAKLQKEIDRLERQTRKEVQPKLKFELYQKLQAKKKQLEDTKNGE